MFAGLCLYVCDITKLLVLYYKV